MALSKTPAAKKARKRSREQTAVRQAMGMTQERYNYLRPKKRKTRADIVVQQLDRMQVSFMGIGLAAGPVIWKTLGKLECYAALTERQQGMLDLIEDIIAELHPRQLIQAVGEATAGEDVSS